MEGIVVILITGIMLKLIIEIVFLMTASVFPQYPNLPNSSGYTKRRSPDNLRGPPKWVEFRDLQC